MNSDLPEASTWPILDGHGKLPGPLHRLWSVHRDVELTASPVELADLLLTGNWHLNRVVSSWSIYVPTLVGSYWTQCLNKALQPFFRTRLGLMVWVDTTPHCIRHTHECIHNCLSPSHDTPCGLDTTWTHGRWLIGRSMWPSGDADIYIFQAPLFFETEQPRYVDSRCDMLLREPTHLMHNQHLISPGQVDCVYAHMHCQTLFTARLAEELGPKSIGCKLL